MSAQLHSFRSFTLSRRQMLRSVSAGFGYLAFASLAQGEQQRDANPLAPQTTHFPARAKRVLFLCMHGGPSHVDTFDYKPQLAADHGQPMPGSRGGGGRRLLGSPWKFQQRGESGLWISELFPELSLLSDDMCLLRGMHTDQPAHPQAMLALHTGTSRFTRPSLGSWALYGLGTENENLPGYVSLNPGRSANHHGSAFLPAIYQGTPIGGGRGGMGGRTANASPAIDDIRNPRWSERQQRSQLDFVQHLNRLGSEQAGDPDSVEAVIASHELAFRMQAVVPEVMDLSQESAATQRDYGLEDRTTAGFGRECLLARRLLEAGVRFVEVGHQGWDQHRQLQERLPQQAQAIDGPIAALLRDLKQRDLLRDTLVIWGGEFGRTPAAQGNDGRDHNNQGYTMWMAGGGVKPGFSYGATDPHGVAAVEGKMHTHDLHATILHLLGLDHTRLTYRYAGRDFRLTDVSGQVATEIVA